MKKLKAIKNLFGQKKSSPETDWDQVYEEVLPKVYNFFRYRFFNNELAEDLTAVTLSRAWQSRDRYQEDLAQFSTWVLGIARHVALDEYRRKQVDEVSLDQLFDIAGDDHVERRVQSRQHIDELKTHLSELSADEQELIGLKYGAGLTNRAIAELTGLSESNVGTTLHRVVKKLRVRMGIKI